MTAEQLFTGIYNGGLVFVLVDTVVPLAIGVEIRRRKQPAPQQQEPAGRKTTPAAATAGADPS